jgi:hypothetical protein
MTSNPSPESTGEAAAPPPATAAKTNVFQRMAGVLFSPAETFADIARQPNILAPLIVYVVMGLISAAIITPRFDFSSIREQQVETMRKRNMKMSEADLDRMARFGEATAKVMLWSTAVLQIAFFALVAGVLLLAFRAMGGEGRFAQAFSATLYAWVPLLIAGIVMAIVILARGSFDPATAGTMVKSNPAFLVDMKEQPVLFTLLSAIDVFSIWVVILFVFGFRALSRLSTGVSAAIVVFFWAFLVAIRVAIAAMST